MDYAQLFDAMGPPTLLGWAILILAPRRWTWLGLVPRILVPLAISLVYTVLMAVHFAASGGGYGSIDAVRTLFASDPVLVAGWGHYLAFDLLVGCFCADRMDRARVHRILQAPILVSVFLFGPVGLVLTLAVEAGQWLAARLSPSLAPDQKEV